MVDALTALKRLRRNIEGQLKGFQRNLRGRTLARKTLAKLKTEPGPPVYPIEWKTLKQRRAFFATGGFGRGIPAARNQPPDVLEGWRVVYDPDERGGTVRVLNPVEHMRYVQGFDQQPFHANTGWVRLNDVIFDFVEEVGDEFALAWFDVDIFRGI